MAKSIDEFKVDLAWLDLLYEKLFEWFASNSRDFPWRHTSDPFEILLAEKLLQQTAARVEVVAAYNKLLFHYGTPKGCAESDLTSLVEIIQPLGLPQRAKDIIDFSRVIVEQHHGLVPGTINELMDLPGVGDYIARAVLCFAYDRCIALVDTNIARWLFRVFDMQGNSPQNPARNRLLIAMAQEMVNESNPRDYHFALLDLCALICTSRNPKCKLCPLCDLCVYGRRQNK